MSKLIAALLISLTAWGTIGANAFAGEQCACQPCKCPQCTCATK